MADQSVTVLTGIKEALGDNGKVIYAKGANVTDDKGIVDFLNLYENAVQVDPRLAAGNDRRGAVAAAKQSDVVVAVVGARRRAWRDECLQPDRYHSCRRASAISIAALKATGKPLVLVLMNGRPLALVKEGISKPMRCWRPGLLAPKAATPSPTCCLATTTRRASCRCLSRARWGRSPTYYSHLNTGRPYNPEKPNKHTPRVTSMKPMARCIRLVTA